MESVNLQVATYSKFQPQSPDFLDITNPKAVYPFIDGAGKKSLLPSCNDAELSFWAQLMLFW